MKYKIKEVAPYGAMLFTRVFTIKAESYNDEIYKEIALWCCDNLQEPFVLLSVRTKIVAGGSTDNKNSYVFRQKENDIMDGELIAHYELRCDDKDAVLFKMRWK